MKVKNKSSRLYTIDGVAIAPGETKEIADSAMGAIQDLVKDGELEVVSGSGEFNDGEVEASARRPKSK